MTSPGVLPVGLIALIVGLLAAADGGFFATSWGWPTLAFLLVAGVALVGARGVRIERRECVLLAALAGLVCWSALSSVWASGAELPVHAAELALLYLAAVAALLALGSASLPLGVLLAAVPVAAYGLATRLLPGLLTSFDSRKDGYLLSVPTGYHNCLGMLCALASLLALGFAAHGERRAGRIAASVSLVVLLPALYFTYSRGAAAAAIVGLLLAVALDTRRRHLSVAALVTLPLPLLGAWLCSRAAGLTRPGSTLAAASHDGHRLALVLIALGAGQAAAAGLLCTLERRIAVTPRARRAYAIALGVLGAVLATVLVARVGDPVAFVTHATDAFRASSPAPQGSLNGRLLTLSGHTRTAYWAAAWSEFTAHPVLGGGGETFRHFWLQYRSVPTGALNAHNLYLETLAELGPVGLALLLAALAVPLWAAVRVRHRPLAPVVAAAYVAALAHAAIDWDWQLPALMLATFALGTSLVIDARAGDTVARRARGARAAAVGALAGLVAFVFVAQLGNEAIAAGELAASRGDQRAVAADVADARGWLPWAAAPWWRLGDAQLAQGRTARARDSYRRAIEKDRGDWATWLDLATVSGGNERSRALSEAARLNPLGGIGLHGP